MQIPGTVVGLVKADFYVDTILNANGTRTPYIDPGVVWGRTCPNWREELVAFVFLNIPQRSATKEEWVTSGVAQGFRKEDCENNYERQCPMVQQLVFPESDLEIVEE